MTRCPRIWSESRFIGATPTSARLWRRCRRPNSGSAAIKVAALVSSLPCRSRENIQAWALKGAERSLDVSLHQFHTMCVNVPELDRLKEQLAYLKFWQGIMVVTDISLVGWLISNAGSASGVTLALAIVGIVSLAFGILVLHRQIESRIDKIGEL